MLEILNRYSHGFVLIPAVQACQTGGFFELLEKGDSFTLDELVRELGANSGHLSIVLRMFLSLGWLISPEENDETRTYALSADALIYREFPEAVFELRRFPMEDVVRGKSELSLAPFIDLSAVNWGLEHDFLGDYLDGMLVIPLLLSLKKFGLLKVVVGEEDRGSSTLEVDSPNREEIIRFFRNKGWVRPEPGSFELTAVGRFILERIFITAALASYKPMFTRMSELLFGDAEAVFARDSSGHELHLDRTLNVVGSGFQHEKYFKELEELIISIFDTPFPDKQPGYIADMGCGDGALLKRVYETVRDKTSRGKVLGEYPLLLLGVDFNEKALRATAATLKDIEHRTIKGDIGDPVQMIADLKKAGIDDSENILHIRSFLDHDRPFRPPENEGELAGRTGLPYRGVYVDRQGLLIDSPRVVQSTTEHLRRWAALESKHGFIILEVHNLAPDVTARFLDEGENFHFDAYHGFSRQYLLEAEFFLLCAAEAGLLPQKKFCKKYPKTLPFSRISLSYFRRRPFSIRIAREADLPALLELEVLCRFENAPAEQDEIRDRLRNFPEGQLLLESEGVIGGALYTRREKQDEVELLYLNLRPGMPGQYGAEFLEFADVYFSLKSGVEKLRGFGGRSWPEPKIESSETSIDSLNPLAADAELAEFCFRRLAQILLELNILRSGETFNVTELIERTGIITVYHRLFNVLLISLSRRAPLKRDNDIYTVLPALEEYALNNPKRELEEFRRDFLRRYPAHTSYFNFVDICLSSYGDILLGKVPVNEVMFPDGSMEIFEAIFKGDPVADYFNNILAEKIFAKAQDRGKGRGAPVRILEIGAGTGGATGAVLKRLEKFSGDIEFYYTDISSTFLRYGQSRFAGRYPRVKFEILNVELDPKNAPENQELRRHSFDIVFASNVIHDTGLIVPTLENIKHFLKPGGLLLLNEFTKVKEFLLFSGGLLHGYWLFKDPENRQENSCLLSVEQWSACLAEAGFEDFGSVVLPAQKSLPEKSQSVMTVLAPAGAAVGANEMDPGAAVSFERNILQEVKENVVKILGAKRMMAFNSARPFMEQGFDSMELMELRTLLSRSFELKLDSSFLFNYTTMDAVVENLESRLKVVVPSPSPEHIAPFAEKSGSSSTSEVSDDPIAIVGIACRFPGAQSPEAFWELLERGRSVIGDVPAGRWNWPDYIDPGGRHPGIERGGFLERIDEFDPDFFRIPPHEAHWMDPQQRLLLELSWETLENAAYRPSSLSGAKVGVYVGACHGDYRELLNESLEEAGAYLGVSSLFSILSNRISYFYNFNGPSFTLDTACSSSLSAVYDAVKDLKKGEIELALVGGVNLICTPGNTISYYKAGMLSPDGMIRAFDVGANGYVRGEGGGMALLKPLKRAEADGNHIYGLLRSVGVNHGGQAGGLTAPRPDAQAELIARVYREAKIAPDTITYVETHGTGTSLGDPIEVQGLKTAFDKSGRQGFRTGIGSVKTNIGHLEAASGIAGLLKVLLALEKKRLPASLNFTKENPLLELENSPFYVVRQSEDWRVIQDEQGRDIPRRAGLSSFGVGGANAHALLEEYVSPGKPQAQIEEAKISGPALVVLSAKTSEALKDSARNLFEFLKRRIRSKPVSVNLSGRIRESLIEKLVQITGVQAHDIDGEIEIAELGLDPLGLNQFRETIGEIGGFEPAPWTDYEDFSVAALAAKLLEDNEEYLREYFSAKSETDAPFDSRNVEPLDIRSLAWTLQTGREVMEHRLAILAHTPEELNEKLESYLKKDDGRSISGVFTGEAGNSGVGDLITGEAGAAFLDLILKNRELDKLARLWVNGANLDWALPYGENKPTPLALPTYPFVRDSYWISPAQNERKPGPRGEKISNPTPPWRLSRSSGADIIDIRFTGREFYLAEHRVRGEKVLPGVVHLEMVRFLAERRRGARVSEISDVTWTKPIIVEDNPLDIKVSFSGAENLSSYKVYGEESDGRKSIYSQGVLRFESEKQEAPPSFDIKELKSRFQTGTGSEDFYKLFETSGVVLGKRLRSIVDFYSNQEEVFARLEVPRRALADAGEFELHPALMDGVYQTIVGLLLKRKLNLYLPFYLGKLEIFASPGVSSRVYGRSRGEGKFELFLLDEAGQVLIRQRGFYLASLSLPPSSLSSTSSGAPDTPDGFVQNDERNLYYEKFWKRSPLDFPEDLNNSEAQPGTTLLFARDESLYAELRARRFRGRGASAPCILIKPGEVYRENAEHEYEIAPGQAEDYRRLFEKLKAVEIFPEQIVLDWFEPGADPLERGFFTIFHLARSLMEDFPGRDFRLIYIYRFRGEISDTYAAALGGFFRTLYQENNKYIFRCLAFNEDSEIAETIDSEFRFGFQIPTNFEVYYEKGSRLLPGWRPVEIKPGELRPRRNGVYLITGGLGGLGLIFARYLAKQYQARLILTGRSALTPEKELILKELGGSGAGAEYFPADVSRPEEVDALMLKILSRYGELTGVLHLAGVVNDSFLRNKSPGRVRAVFAPKIQGVLNLDRALKRFNPDFFVLFSSIAAGLGNPGQIDYAYANSFLDQFALFRENLRKDGRRTGKTLSINWPLWRGGGMAPDEVSERLLHSRTGSLPLYPGDGLEIFENALSYSGAVLMALRGRKDDIELNLEKPPEARREKPSPAGDVGKKHEIKFLEELRQIMADILRIPAENIVEKREMNEFGFNSLSFTDFSNRLNERYDFQITPSIFFDVHTLLDLRDYLQGEYGRLLENYYQLDAPEKENTFSKEPPAPSGLTDSSPRPLACSSENMREPIAIVGMAGKMPGSPDLESFWRHLEAGHDLIEEVPADRWDWRRYYGDPDGDSDNGSEGPFQTRIKWGGFMPEVDCFDAAFFNISPLEAELMDPQQRLFLESAWKAVEDAGFRPQDLAQSETGVFAGVAFGDYRDLCLTGNVPPESPSAVGVAQSLLANRVSFIMNLTGPSETIDTACSSSLTALHLAINAIYNGDCQMALVGGVNALLSPINYISFAKGGMLSPDGRCKTFDESANGYARGEGVGALVLMPLSRAKKEGAHIYGLIKGSAVNHGGRAASLTAPASGAQANLLFQAYRRAELDPATVSYIETHGTGTALGDPVEVEGLKQAFRNLNEAQGEGLPLARVSKAHIALGAVKSNIGHLESAAGVAGVMKVLLAMKHRTLPGNLHIRKINPYIDLKNSPFYILKETRPWVPLKNEIGEELPRRAGVSSFAIGGANAHVVLEEYLPELKGQTSSQYLKTWPVPLSARSEERLFQYARDLLDFLGRAKTQSYNKSNAPAPDISEIAYTLQVGRNALEFRLVILADDTGELIAKLKKFLSKAAGIPGVFSGEIAEKIAGERNTFEEAEERKTLEELARLWVRGAAVNWKLLYTGEPPGRISLPTYPFARNRHRVAGGDLNSERGARAIHPFLDRVLPVFKAEAEVVFEKKFFPGDVVLREHIVAGEQILPGVVYLEMIQAALEELGLNEQYSLAGLVWLKPFRLNENDNEPEAGRNYAARVDALRLLIRQARQEYEIEIVSLLESETRLHVRARLEDRKTISGEERGMHFSLSEIRERCVQRVDSEEHYNFFDRINIKYGPYFRGVRYIDRGQGESLAFLARPPANFPETESYFLHPTILDGALQVIGVMTERLNRPLLPYALESLRFFKTPGPEVFAYVRQSGNELYDIDLLDETGQVCIKLEGLAVRILKSVLPESFQNSRPGQSAHVTQSYYIPRWVPLVEPSGSPANTASPDKASVWILHHADNQGLVESLSRLHQDDTLNCLDLENVGADLASKLSSLVRPNLVYFLGKPGKEELEDLELEDFERSMEVYSFLRLLRGLKGLEERIVDLNLKVITWDVCDSSESPRVNPESAALHGFTIALAREYSNWNINLLDLDSRALERGGEAELEKILKSVEENNFHPGEIGPVALRNGEFLRKALFPVQLPGIENIIFKTGGVYLILGGAKGIGLELAVYLARQYQARLALVGRSELNPEIEIGLKRVRAAGGEVLYLEADGSDVAGMSRVVRSIKTRFGSIQGTIHSAIVLEDRSVERMDESALERALKPKVQGSVVLEKVLRDEPLEFMLFFSSLQSFTGNVGQSNYAAACAFKDAFALALRKNVSYPVRVINWGYWGSVGVVASDTYRERLKARGYGSTEPAAGMEAIHRILNNRLAQVISFQASEPGPDIPGLLPEAEVEMYGEEIPSIELSVKL